MALSLHIGLVSVVVAGEDIFSIPTSIPPLGSSRCDTRDSAVSRHIQLFNSKQCFSLFLIPVIG